MVLSFISATLGAILLLVGVASLFSPKVRAILRMIPIGNPKLWGIVLIAVGVLAGGFGVITGYVTNSTASITNGKQTAVQDVTGELVLSVNTGLSNATTTEDYYNDENTEMTIYSADANIADDLDYAFNISISRSLVSEDANVKVTCSAPDKELSGVTDDNLIDKDAGQIDLVFSGASSSTGTYASDTEVWTYVAFSEGDGVQHVTVTAEHVEAYHDGMADLDDYFDINCDADGNPVRVRIFANS